MSAVICRVVSALVVLCAAVFWSGTASAVPTDRPADPTTTAAATKYLSLSRVGVSAGAGRVTGRDLQVSLRLRQRTRVQLAVVKGKRVVASARPKTLAKGRRRLSVKLNRTPSGSGLKLRITAQNLKTRKRGRGLKRLTVVVPAPTPTPTPTPIPTPIPTASPTPEPTATPSPTAAPNNAPSDIALNNATVDEAQSGASVGTLSTTDADATDTHSYSLVSGTGDADNASFVIDGTLLKTAAALDFESQPSLSVRLRVADDHGGAFEKAFAITVTDVNDVPTGLSLSGTSVAENAALESVVGTLSASDQDAGQTLTYALVAGAGDTDNASFTIDGDTLETADSFDFEAKSSYTVRIAASDGNGGTSAAPFAITVTDVNEAPTGLALSDSAVEEQAAIGTVVGNFSALDPDAGQTLTYTLVSGTGDTDNASFTIDGDALETAAVFDFTAKSSYSIRVRVSDGAGGTTDKGFTISVTEVTHAPVVTLASTALGYTEGAAPVVLDDQLGLSDGDSADLVGATIRISTGLGSGDQLAFTAGNGISGVYETGLLSLSGTATVAQYQQALRTVTYASTSESPVTSKEITVIVDDGTTESAPVTRPVAVTAVNDAPTVTATLGARPYTEGDGAVLADDGLTVADPDSQITGASVQITSGFVAAEDALAFADANGITGSYDDVTGSLTLSGAASPADYRAALRAVTYANGSDSPTPARTLTFSVTDAEGATADDTRDIAISAVDDAPAAVGDAATVLEDAAATAIPVLTNDTDVDGGPKSITEVTQPTGGTVAITGGGSGLTYAPDADLCNGPDPFTYTLNGGSQATVTMTVTCVNDAPVAGPDDFAGGIHGVRLRVGSTHPDSHEVEVTGDVLDNDTDVDTPVANLTTTPGQITSAGCAGVCAGNVTMASDGSFTYDPPAGHGATDTFTYVVNDNDTGDTGSPAQTHTNTVTVNYSGTRVWFVDDSAPAGGRGVSHAPLQTLAPLAAGGSQNGLDGTGDRIFVRSGTYTTGIDLEPGQRLLGEPQGLNVASTQLVAAGGTKPAISSSAGNVVTLHSGANEVRNVALGNSPAAGYSLVAPVGAGAFTVADTDIDNATGGGLNILDGIPSVTLGTLSSTGSSSNGVRISDTEAGGTVTSTAGTLSNASGADFSMSNAHTTVNLGSAISDDLGQLVSVSGGSSAVTYNGTITDLEDGDGNGISITGTSGAHNFTKSVRLSTGTAAAMTMTSSAGSLRMVPTAGTNRLTTTAGAALTVTDTPIHANGLSFEKIESVDPTIDASTYGIHLSNTGSGSLTVAGTGVAGSGGVIQGKSTGIKLNNTASPSFTRMKLTNHGDFAIKGDTVTGFTLASSVIDGSVGRNGDNASADEGAVSFDELLGSATISNSTIREGFENDLRVRNDSGTLNRLNVSGTTFGGSSAEHNDSVQLEANGFAALNATIQGSTFTGARGDQVQATIQDSATGDIEVLNNTLTNGHASSLGGGIVLASAGSGDMTYAVNSNNVQGAKGSAIATGKLYGTLPSNGTAVGTISGNTIGSAAVAGSGSLNGSAIDASVLAQGKHSVQITNNTIRQYRDNGILLTPGGAAAQPGVTHNAIANYTVTGNSISTPGPGAAFPGGGIHLNSGTNTGDVYAVCLGLANNTVAGSATGGGSDYILRQRIDTIVRLPGYTGPEHNGAGTLNSQMASYLTPRTTGGFTLLVTAQNFNAGGGGWYNTVGGAPCPTT